MKETAKKFEVVINGDLSEEEVASYVTYAENQESILPLIKLEINVFDEDVELVYHYQEVPFERIRRITGYLVGTTNRFNDGKLAELNHRVKHEL